VIAIVSLFADVAYLRLSRYLRGAAICVDTLSAGAVFLFELHLRRAYLAWSVLFADAFLRDPFAWSSYSGVLSAWTHLRDCLWRGAIAWSLPLRSHLRGCHLRHPFAEPFCIESWLICVEPIFRTTCVEPLFAWTICQEHVLPEPLSRGLYLRGATYLP
jgi:hypothetical protein